MLCFSLKNVCIFEKWTFWHLTKYFWQIALSFFITLTKTIRYKFIWWCCCCRDDFFFLEALPAHHPYRFGTDGRPVTNSRPRCPAAPLSRGCHVVDKRRTEPAKVKTKICTTCAEKNKELPKGKKNEQHKSAFGGKIKRMIDRTAAPLGRRVNCLSENFDPSTPAYKTGPGSRGDVVGGGARLPACACASIISARRGPIRAVTAADTSISRGLPATSRLWSV